MSDEEKENEELQNIMDKVQENLTKMQKVIEKKGFKEVSIATFMTCSNKNGAYTGRFAFVGNQYAIEGLAARYVNQQ